MASAIGLRVYRIGVHARGKSSLVAFDDEKLNQSVPDFITAFMKLHNSVVQNDALERSWYFEEKDEDGPGNSQGYVHYGTFGFESDFIDTKTKKKNYRRKTTDIEEIPLFYEFWCPDQSAFGLATFQSFQGRSCISLVMTKMKEAFENANPDHILSFKKLLPNDAKGSAYYSAPVKQLRLIKRKASSDIADRYFDNPSPEPIDFEIIMSARRRKNLGDLTSLLKSVRSDGAKTIITHDGIEFSEAVAEIRVGNRTRRVGVLGFNGEAGVIDVTDVIVRGADGHPTFESLKKESDSILRDFFETLEGSKE
ncbi:hypothetical protein [Sphingomonas trueperi]|uniref:hypothetical protein n=1 Tax=Sphingomonas trueperi TaxID=53317 RepID=UPI000F10B40A